VGDNSKSLAFSEKELFLEPLKDFSRLIGATKETITRRDEAKKVYVAGTFSSDLLT
jgi:hypothetical protein